MITRVFSQKLKTFSNRHPFRFLSLLTLAVFVISGCAGTSISPEEQLANDRLIAQRQSLPKHDTANLGERSVGQLPPRAPWELWSGETWGNPELAVAERLASEGRIREALDAYGNADNSLANTQLQQEALLRSAGTLLKLGRSQDALELVSKRFAEQSISTEMADPRIAIVVAYAYEHQGDIDQTLSWLAVAYRNDQKRSEAGVHAVADVQRVLRGISAESFEAEEQKWEADGFVGPLFTAERKRRAQGGRPEQLLMSKWYQPTTYQVGSDQQAAELLQPPSGEQPVAKEGLVIGALLPLSGKFAEHGLRVKEGLELAVEQAQREGKVVQLIVGDTAGEPQTATREYERLARESAHIIMGPLLVNTTLSVAKQSEKLQVPFISFTKREKVLGKSKVGFRLGVTAEDQIRDLLSYATKEAKFSRFAVLYPENENGRELVAAFRKLAPQLGSQLGQQLSAQIVAESAYSARNPASIDAAVRMLEGNPPQAIFIAEALENCGPILQAIKAGALAQLTILGSATWDDPAALRSFGGMLEGAVYVSPFYLRSTNPESAAFVEAYRARYQQDPGVLSAQAFDAAELAIKSFSFGGMREVQESRALVAGNIRNLRDYEGVTGLLTVGESGEISRRMTVIRYAHGDLVEVMARGLKTSFAADEADEKEIGPIFR